MHALAKTMEEKLERGGGKHTHKRRNEGLEFASPAKKRKINFSNLQDFWANIGVETLKSSPLLKTSFMEGKSVLPESCATTKVSQRLSEN